MTRLKMTRLYQADILSEIYIELASQPEQTQESGRS
jgi:hypothetical protein